MKYIVDHVLGGRCLFLEFGWGLVVAAGFGQEVALEEAELYNRAPVEPHGVVVVRTWPRGVASGSFQADFDFASEGDKEAYSGAEKAAEKVAVEGVAEEEEHRSKFQAPQGALKLLRAYVEG